MLNYKLSSLPWSTLFHCLRIILLLLVEAMTCLVHNISRRTIHHVKVWCVLLILLDYVNVLPFLRHLATLTVSMRVCSSRRAHGGDIFIILERVSVHCKHVWCVYKSSLLGVTDRIWIFLVVSNWVSCLKIFLVNLLDWLRVEGICCGVEIRDLICLACGTHNIVIADIWIGIDFY